MGRVRVGLRKLKCCKCFKSYQDLKLYITECCEQFYCRNCAHKHCFKEKLCCNRKLDLPSSVIKHSNNDFGIIRAADGGDNSQTAHNDVSTFLSDVHDDLRGVSRGDSETHDEHSRNIRLERTSLASNGENTPARRYSGFNGHNSDIEDEVIPQGVRATEDPNNFRAVPATRKRRYSSNHRKKRFDPINCRHPGCEKVITDGPEGFKKHLTGHYRHMIDRVVPRSKQFTCPNCPTNLSSRFCLLHHYAWTCDQFFEVTHLDQNDFPEVKRKKRKPRPYKKNVKFVLEQSGEGCSWNGNRKFNVSFKRSKVKRLKTRETGIKTQHVPMLRRTFPFWTRDKIKNTGVCLKQSEAVRKLVRQKEAMIMQVSQEEEEEEEEEESISMQEIKKFIEETGKTNETEDCIFCKDRISLSHHMIRDHYREHHNAGGWYDHPDRENSLIKISQQDLCLICLHEPGSSGNTSPAQPQHYDHLWLYHRISQDKLGDYFHHHGHNQTSKNRFQSNKKSCKCSSFENHQTKMDLCRKGCNSFKVIAAGYDPRLCLVVGEIQASETQLLHVKFVSDVSTPCLNQVCLVVDGKYILLASNKRIENGQEEPQVGEKIGSCQSWLGLDPNDEDRRIFCVEPEFRNYEDFVALRYDLSIRNQQTFSFLREFIKFENSQLEQRNMNRIWPVKTNGNLVLKCMKTGRGFLPDTEDYTARFSLVLSGDILKTTIYSILRNKQSSKRRHSDENEQPPSKVMKPSKNIPSEVHPSSQGL